MNAFNTDTAIGNTLSGRSFRKRMTRIARLLIASQVALSRVFDRLLPQSFRIDGSKDFKRRIVPSYLRPDLVIYDIGGGARPCVDLETKRRLGLKITGVDIDDEQFAKAPPGLYDCTIAADITTYHEQNAADLVICKSTLEHVRNTEAALATMARLLNPGGILLVFVPSRNALYARLNLLLPQHLKMRLLTAFMPDRIDHLGFPTLYDHCTPRDFCRFATSYGLEIKDLRPYYISSYFSVVFPVYVLWRVWILAYRAVAREQAAESFVLIARKPAERERTRKSSKGSRGRQRELRKRDSTLERILAPRFHHPLSESRGSSTSGAVGALLGWLHQRGLRQKNRYLSVIFASEAWWNAH
jgi:2-polyprenyl-3-methyl-5-hydroxy-6-metoxy-1,4-benzoquinol methylase